MHPQENKSYQYLIVGQGLAGSVLALSLMQAGCSVMVIDNPKLSQCSRVAGGAWNPIVFKRLTKSWLADELLPELNLFYTYWEEQFKSSFVHQRSIIKSFTEEQEERLWLKKAIEGNQYLDNTIYKQYPLNHHYTVASYSKVLQAGNINIPLFLDLTKQYLIQNNAYTQHTFNYHHLKIHELEIAYESLNASQIIFCDGHLISQQPYFNFVPMKPVKGETLIIYCEGINLERDILTTGFFMLPLGHHTYKIGATYDWENLNDIPSEKGKQFLIEKFEEVIKLPYQIIEHQAGVRPSVIDRRPVIGRHPIYTNLLVFNGFGTKAVMLAPYFAKQFTQHLLQNQNLHPEVDVKRFYDKLQS